MFYHYLSIKFLTAFHFILNFVHYFPLFFLLFFTFYITIFLRASLRNIFKIFFFTESILLISVLLIVQYGSILNFDAPLHYFYCQLILASAAAEAALFLGIFSHLYDQQFLNRVNSKNFIDSSFAYYFIKLKLKNVKIS